ncbi:hypothetical protein [Tengunoibacter tsumagoiensis]|uniref:Uncharacterized protein n=1 Tax=Tengunoibacter tsumagoiensis TaxID=2014871 RepID=A0A401ZZX7_9CHLR|nr:hypothetical protein [Tengunoibacter tsumagoiensis]GCE12447.1 hypothetical protein KTT_23060 [Tengunoibacter tsumagoiensis]
MRFVFYLLPWPIVQPAADAGKDEPDHTPAGASAPLSLLETSSMPFLL